MKKRLGKRERIELSKQQRLLKARIKVLERYERHIDVEAARLFYSSIGRNPGHQTLREKQGLLDRSYVEAVRRLRQRPKRHRSPKPITW